MFLSKSKKGQSYALLYYKLDVKKIIELNYFNQVQLSKNRVLFALVTLIVHSTPIQVSTSIEP